MNIRVSQLCIIMLFMLFVSPLLAAKAEIRFSIKNSLINDQIPFGAIATNHIRVSCLSKRDVSDLICLYPADPNIYGLDVVSAFYKEKLFFQGGVVSKKDFLITYLFKPKFVGVIGVKPIQLQLISVKDKLTNTLYTATKKLEVSGKGSSSLFLYIGLVTVMVIVLSLLVVRMAKKRKKA